MKTIILSALLFAATIASAFSVPYSNKDSKTYKWEVKLNGTTRTIEFKSGTSGTASIGMSASKVEIKTECGWVKVEDGDKVIIKDGCLKID